MVTRRLTMRAVAGLTLWTGFGSAAQAELPPITAEQAFNIQPRQQGVTVSTPAPGQVKQCTVAPIPNPNNPKDTMGYVVRDPAGKPVRQFVSYDGKTYNVIAFYLDGAEAYREVYPPDAKEPYQFRWLGPNGTKWGLDRDRDGKVDEWIVLSPEELTQELLAAVLTKDAKRVEPLLVTRANLDTIGLKGAEAQKLLDRAAGATGRVMKAGDELKASAEAKWGHVELNAPQAIPADALGSRDDLIVHKNGTVLVQEATGKEPKFLQTGELVQAGRVWKIIDGPSVGLSGMGGGGPVIPDALRPLLSQLDKIDQEGPAQPMTAETMAAFNAKRAAVLEQIVAKLEPKDQETWAKLLVDSLSAAAEGEKSDGKHLTRLKQFKETLAKGPNPNLAAYATFRFLLAENSVTLANADSGKLKEVQEKWRASLEEFIRANPKADDTPEATLRLAMAYEFMLSKEGDDKAKEWYGYLAKNYTGHPHAAKATGAIRRLESEGQPLQLAATDLAGKQFDITSFKGKVVVVYYCANWSSTLADDARKLKALVKEFGPKGLEMVTVCLDNDPKTSFDTVTKAGLPGTHLFALGGLDGSPLAAQYGVVVVPHFFVVGKDGKVVNRNGQAATLEEDVKKLLP